ncbi:retron system putative HNH endonuclease [Sphingomonas sp. LB3N6]|uniref:retron system putative HNH endonuclease n=1 Tax=Sphingomonas fucosidasi TaxID=3096164 RepID=UPI002FCA1077
MRTVVKGAAPLAFVAWLNLANEDWTPTYGNLSGEPMTAAREALLKEHQFLCAYCGRAVLADGSDSHIEHFFPQKKFRNWSVEWWNLFISCGRATGDTCPATCGTEKEDWIPSPNFIIPSSPDSDSRFRYDGLGNIGPTNSPDLAATTMIHRLALDDDALALERRQIIAALEADVAAGELSPATIAAEIERWHTADPSGRLKAFSQVAARYLEDELI